MPRPHTLTLPYLALLLASLACNTLQPPRPALTWDTTPATVIIELTTSGGLVPMEYVMNALPTARLWGDGRMIWVEYTSGGGRRVLEGHLSAQEMTDLLTQVSDAGFFGWANYYRPRAQVFDAGTTTLTVNLPLQTKSVSEYAGEGAPEKFHALTGLLSSGAGASGAEFVPAKGYLLAFPRGEASGQAQYHWPESSLGYGLDQAVSGIYIEGEGLEFAWKAVNESQFAIIESGGMDYQIAVQIPGVSQQEPPAGP